MVWIEYLICASVILTSGSLLSKYGDMLAEKTGMGRTWIGLILLATVTSLPELATGLSAVTLADAPDIAVGNVLGACVFNLFLIGILDLFYRPAPILSRVQHVHILSAALGSLMLGLAGWGMLLKLQGVPTWELWVGPSTPLILAVYVLGIRMVFTFEVKRIHDRTETESEVLLYRDIPKERVYRGIILHAIVIIAAGTWLSFIGDRLAEATGWGESLVGNIFVAASTTLPEMVTSLTALRLGAVDLAISNLLGSNLFNVAILAVDDLVYVKGPLLTEASSLHLFPALSAVMMTAVTIAGLIYHTRKNLWRTLSWESAALIVFYLMNATVLFIMGR